MYALAFNYVHMCIICELCEADYEPIICKIRKHFERKCLNELFKTNFNFAMTFLVIHTEKFIYS